MVITSIRSSRIIAKGSENQRSAPKTVAASRALCSLRVATAESFTPGRPLIAGTCDTFAQLDLAFAPTIPTRISFLIHGLISFLLPVLHRSATRVPTYDSVPSCQAQESHKMQ